MPGSAVAAELPSSATLLALTPVILLVVGLVVFCLVDLVRAPSVKYLPKIVWALIIVVGSTPLGAIGYLVFGRERGPTRQPVAVPTSVKYVGAPSPPPVDDVAELTGSAIEHPPTGHAPTNPAPTVHATTDRATTDQPEPPVVETLGLTRDYGGGGLFDVNLSVPRGCVYGLVGPNGAGKTTMLSILSGMRRADRGDVRLSLPRNAVAVCPDVPEFDGWLTAYEVVDLARSLVSAEPAGDKVVEALRTAGLDDAADRTVGEFSRGMTQRLGLACALVGDPQLLILDEPTSALDPAGRAEVLDLVSGMRGRHTVIFSSHILADVQRVADRVGILRDGRLLYQGPTQALIDTHLQPRWLVRIAGAASPFCDELVILPWVTRADAVGEHAVRVDAVSIEAGERGIPMALTARHERLVSCEPVAADLESAFLALTMGDDRDRLLAGASDRGETMTGNRR